MAIIQTSIIMLCLMAAGFILLITTIVPNYQRPAPSSTPLELPTLPPSLFDVALQQIKLFLGFFFVTVSLGWFHYKSKISPLKILDSALICFLLCMMPIFGTLGLIPWLWWFLFCGTLIVRYLIDLYVNWRRKK